MIAYCGIVCTECPAYLATTSDDDQQRRKVAENWSQQYNSDIKPEDINREGCLPGHNVYFGHCAKCEIRACGIGRGVENCAYCDDFACQKLESFFAFVPDARSRLTDIRSRA